MIKKINLILILCCLIISCGKKGDPVFKESQKTINTQNISVFKS